MEIKNITTQVSELGKELYKSIGEFSIEFCRDCKLQLPKIDLNSVAKSYATSNILFGKNIGSKLLEYLLLFELLLKSTNYVTKRIIEYYLSLKSSKDFPEIPSEYFTKVIIKTTSLYEKVRERNIEYQKEVEEIESKEIIKERREKRIKELFGKVEKEIFFFYQSLGENFAKFLRPLIEKYYEKNENLYRIKLEVLKWLYALMKFKEDRKKISYFSDLEPLYIFSRLPYQERLKILNEIENRIKINLRDFVEELDKYSRIQIKDLIEIIQ